MAQSYRETNNEHTLQISILNFNSKVSYFVQCTDNSNNCVFTDKWSAIKMASLYKRLQDVQKERAISLFLYSPLSTQQ